MSESFASSPMQAYMTSRTAQPKQESKKKASDGILGRRERRRTTLLKNVEKKFVLDVEHIREPVSVFWKRQVLATKEDILSGKLNISVRDLREILWDLYEHNFRLEFLCLDRCIRPREGLPPAKTLELDSQVTACFPEGTLVNVNFPRNDEGLAALVWKDRARYVEAFRSVLATWGGPEAEKLSKMRTYVSVGGGKFKTDEEMVMAVESISHGFYCQTFFMHFGRAPTIPYSVPL